MLLQLKNTSSFVLHSAFIFIETYAFTVELQAKAKRENQRKFSFLSIANAHTCFALKV